MAKTTTYIRGIDRNPKGHRLYAVWYSMVHRCTDPNHQEWKNYGERGIRVCERWMVYLSFFKDVIDGWRPGLSLEREKNNGNYEPSNVRWATRSEQSRNMRVNVWLTHNGETMILTDWAARVGINCKTLQYRIRSGWPVGEALTQKLAPGIKLTQR